MNFKTTSELTSDAIGGETCDSRRDVRGIWARCGGAPTSLNSHGVAWWPPWILAGARESQTMEGGTASQMKHSAPPRVRPLLPNKMKRRRRSASGFGGGHGHRSDAEELHGPRARCGRRSALRSLDAGRPPADRP